MSMLSPCRLFSLASIMASIATCTPLEKQKPLTTTALRSIPGGTTFTYCPESDPGNDIFKIEKIVWEPFPPKINRDQQLKIFGTFSRRLPSNATGTGTVHVPEWHDPYDPASNYTGSGPFCTWQNYIYQSDAARGLHKVCDGGMHDDVPGNYSAPEAGPAVLVSEDILFWPLPEGRYYAKLDTRMPDREHGGERDGEGERIYCVEGSVDLDYY